MTDRYQQPLQPNQNQSSSPSTPLAQEVAVLLSPLGIRTEAFRLLGGQLNGDRLLEIALGPENHSEILGQEQVIISRNLQSLTRLLSGLSDQAKEGLLEQALNPIFNRESAVAVSELLVVKAVLHLFDKLSEQFVWRAQELFVSSFVERIKVCEVSNSEFKRVYGEHVPRTFLSSPRFYSIVKTRFLNILSGQCESNPTDLLRLKCINQIKSRLLADPDIDTSARRFLVAKLRGAPVDDRQIISLARELDQKAFLESFQFQDEAAARASTLLKAKKFSELGRLADLIPNRLQREELVETAGVAVIDALIEAKLRELPALEIALQDWLPDSFRTSREFITAVASGTIRLLDQSDQFQSSCAFLALLPLSYRPRVCRLPPVERHAYRAFQTYLSSVGNDCTAWPPGTDKVLTEFVGYFDSTSIGALYAALFPEKILEGNTSSDRKLDKLDALRGWLRLLKCIQTSLTEDRANLTPRLISYVLVAIEDYVPGDYPRYIAQFKALCARFAASAVERWDQTVQVLLYRLEFLGPIDVELSNSFDELADVLGNGRSALILKRVANQIRAVFGAQASGDHDQFKTSLEALRDTYGRSSDLFEVGAIPANVLLDAALEIDSLLQFESLSPERSFQE